MLELIKESRNNLRGIEDAQVEYNVLTLIVGELETASKRSGKPVKEEEVVAMIKKIVKSNNETLALRDSEKLRQENAYLKKFLPEELTEEQIRSELQFSHTTTPFSNIGEAIKFLNTKHPGKFDKSLASKVAKELF